VSELSPLGVAVWKRALPVVKYLAERQSTSGAGLREYLQKGWTSVKDGITFSMPILPLLHKTRDIDTLNYLLRQPFFILTRRDLLSFISLASSTPHSWLQGAKSFLQSPATQVVYQSL